MPHHRFQPCNPCQPLGHTFCEIHGAVLAAGAAEGDLKMIAAIFEIFVNRLADERFCRAEKAINLVFVAIEEVADWLVAAGVAAQRFVPIRIRHRPAVKHIATAVACFVLRQPALEREG